MVEYDLEIELKRSPTDSELAQRMGISMEKIRSLKQVERDTISLDYPTKDDGDSVLGDFVLLDKNSPEKKAIRNQATDVVNKILNSFKDPRQEIVLRLRFGINGPEHTLQEIADKYNVSRERIRQIEKAALKKFQFYARINGVTHDVLPE